MSSSDENCSICKRTLAGDKTKELKLSCKHRFHIDCATKRLNISKSPHCPICKKADALEHAMHRALVVSNRYDSFDESQSFCLLMICRMQKALHLQQNTKIILQELAMEIAMKRIGYVPFVTSQINHREIVAKNVEKEGLWMSPQ